MYSLVLFSQEILPSTTCVIAVKWDLESLYSSQGEPLLSQGPLHTLFLNLALVSQHTTSDSS